MNSSDNWLERPRKKQAERKESKRKLAEIKGFFKRNARRFAVAGFFVFILFWITLLSGRGGTATIYITSSQAFFDGHPCHDAPVPPCALRTSSCLCLLGFRYEGIINVTFNPWLYPVNHLLGSEVSVKFTRWHAGGVSTEESLKESLIMETLLSEFPINIPFFYAAGFILAVGLEKVFWKRLR